MKIRPAEEQVCVKETMSWLHTCWELTEANRPLVPDPFYARNVELTPAIVKLVVDDMEGIYRTEIEKYPGYHRAAQGISVSEYLVVPGFDKLPYTQQFAMVQGIDRIFQAHRWTEEDEAAEQIRLAAVAVENERRNQEQMALRAANLATNPHYYDVDEYGYD